MKQIPFIVVILLYLFLFIAPLNILQAQANCVLQPPMLRIDFGSGNNAADPNLSSLENYERILDECPQDGNYAILSYTSGCNSGHWITLSQDHTHNAGGNMLVVNAAYQPDLFFVTELKGLLSNTTYELAAWLVNLCRPEFDCTSIRPSLRFTIEDTEGKELAKFSTGDIVPTGTVTWLQYSGMFKTPEDVGTLILKIANKANGGCGNDFAMDDITVSECVVPKPIVKNEPKPKPVIKHPVPVTKPVAKQTPPVLKPVKKIIPVITTTPLKDTPVISRPVINDRPAISLPKPILTRSNPIVKQIETVSSEIVIDLYDNGEIDGDTVSVYHNNVLIVSRAGLTEKAITFRFNVDAMHPHHELVMVANNLGSIPPNTSLMIITAKGKRYEVFISSSEQKNAKVVIDLKE
ncbi:MAG: hypothetical protein ABI707_07010 [Ferruginibacter sp.]